MLVAFPHAEFGAWDEEETRLQRRLAKIMVRSVKASMPYAKVVQLTDSKTPSIPGCDAVVREKIGKWFIDWILGLYSALKGEVVLLDTDLVVQKDLGVLFERDFDLLMASKTDSYTRYIDPQGIEHKMPMNMGMCLSKNPEIWKEMLARVQKFKDEGIRAWWGAQVVAYELHKERKFKFYALPVDPYNYAPQTEDEDTSEKWVVHYKGRKRKRWMLRHESQGETAKA